MLSLGGWAHMCSHVSNVDIAVASCINLLHEQLDFLDRHLGAHVCHVLLELGYGDALVLVTI